MNGAVAKRYARALIAAAGDGGKVDQVADELRRTAAWLEDPELSRALGSPMLPAKARADLLGQVVSSLSLSTLVRDFLAMLGEKGRMGDFAGIQRAYEGMADAAAGRVRATVRSAQPIADASLAELVGVLEKIAGRKVLPAVEIDPALIGGLTVEMQGTVYDGSVRTQLEGLARTMAKAD